MSLFGTSPEDPSAGDSAHRSKSSLFADEPATGGSSLFADDDGDESGSPWNIQHNTAKRTARRDLVRTLLPTADVPESYIDAYDLILNSGDRVGSGIGLTSVREILSSSGLSATDQSKILNLVSSGDHESFSGLGREEFNVLLALVGLAQEGEDLSFDAVDDRRKSKLNSRFRPFLIWNDISCKVHLELPQPKAGYLDRLRTTSDASSEQPYQQPATPPSRPPPFVKSGSTESEQPRRESLVGLESDPWGSPQLHRGHNHETEVTEPPILNGFGSVRSTADPWSTKPAEDTTQSNVGQREHANGRTEPVPPSSSGSGWGNNNFGGPSEQSFGPTERPGLGGFGPPGDEAPIITPQRRSNNLGRSTNPQVEETVTVALLPEKEGLFMFQHRNYEVKSARRGSTVIRRYSDFVWLLDCLQKRFPFRQLPLLPPKRVSGMWNAG
jgi:sorting nexin-8